MATAPPPRGRTLHPAARARAAHGGGGGRAGLRTRARTRAAGDDAYSGVRLRELKRRADAAGIATAGLFDRESIVAALAAAEASPQQEAQQTRPTDTRGGNSGDASGSAGEARPGGEPPAVVAPIRWEEAASLYAGIKTQQGEYAALGVTTPTGSTVMVLDTAASTTLLTPAAAAALRCTRTGVTAGPGVGGTGTTEASYQVAMGSVRLTDALASDGGGATDELVPGLNAVVMELPTGAGTGGILGLDFLSSFDAVELSWAARPGEVRFVRRGACTAASWAALTRGLTEVILQPLALGLLAVEVSVDGSAAIPALLDTGACFSTVNSAAAATLGLRGDSSIEPMWVAGANGSPVAMRVAERDSTLSVGGCTAGSVRLLIGDLPAFASIGLGAGGSPGMLLGLDVLALRPRVVLSTATRRLLL